MEEVSLLSLEERTRHLEEFRVNSNYTITSTSVYDYCLARKCLLSILAKVCHDHLLSSYTSIV